MSWRFEDHSSYQYTVNSQLNVGNRSFCFFFLNCGHRSDKVLVNIFLFTHNSLAIQSEVSTWTFRRTLNCSSICDRNRRFWTRRFLSDFSGKCLPGAKLASSSSTRRVSANLAMNSTISARTSRGKPWPRCRHLTKFPDESLFHTMVVVFSWRFYLHWVPCCRRNS